MFPVLPFLLIMKIKSRQEKATQEKPFIGLNAATRESEEKDVSQLV
jgi:hypothetical protein